MNPNVELEKLADEMLVVLANDIAHVEITLERLDALRAAVIKHDEQMLRCLLETVQNERESYLLVENRRERIRQRIATVSGCDPKEMNLTALCSLLEGERKNAVSSKQRQLRTLMDRLEAEHTATTMLLRECSRLNRAMLKGIFGRGNETVTYTARGKAKWEVQNEMVNMRL